MFYLVVVGLAALFLATLEISGSLFAAGSMPHLVLAFLIALSLLGQSTAAYVVIALGGLILDSYSGFWPGMQPALLLFVGVGLLTVNRRLLQQPPFLVAAGIALLVAAAYDTAIGLFGDQLDIALLVPAFNTAAVSLIFYAALLRLKRKREVIRLGEHF